jgi:dipeptidase E
MKLYLSSYRIGNHGAVLASLVGGRKRVAVIRNALDFSDDQERLRLGREREFQALRELGLSPSELDLRPYFGVPERLAEVMPRFDGVWVVGGNVFLLRRAMRLSGLDGILRERIHDSRFVYAGYSAGACVLAPTLEGIHLADEPSRVPQGYPPEILWDGLGFLPFCIAPHYRSDHPESEMIERVVEYFLQNQIPFIALRDGAAYVAELRAPPSDGLRRIVTVAAEIPLPLQ